MKHARVLLLFIITCTLPIIANDLGSGILDPYLASQVALANDALAPAKEAAGRIASEARGLGAAGAPIEAAAVSLQRASDLASARTAFGHLSDAVLKYVDTTGTALGTGLHVAYCPMVKQSWVQKGTAIVNPYGGTKMQKCGEIVTRTK